jgi:hypothetical protein
MHTQRIQQDDVITEREPTVGKWYCGMLEQPSFEDQPDQGELMRYDGDGRWTNEQEDPDGREPDPADYDYLVEQL